MAVREDLEEALVANWNLDDLTVYADHLLAEGDPRGELIALDLQPAPHSPEWQARRDAVLRGWLGSSLAARAGGLIRHGFIHELDDGKGASGAISGELLDSPAGAFVRAYTMRGQATRVRAQLARFIAKPRPHCKVLKIQIRGSGEPRDPVVSGATTTALIAALPRLAELEVGGRRVFPAFPHPALRRLHLSNHDSIDVVNPGITVGGGFLRVTCHAGTGRFTRAMSAAELKRALETIGGTPDYNALYATSADTFAESLPALVARLESAGLVHVFEGQIALTSAGQGVLRGSLAAPVLRRTLERPVAPVPRLARDNNVWLETRHQIAFVGHIHGLSSLACLWLQRLPLAGGTRRIVEDFLGVLHDLRLRSPRAHIDATVSANLDRVLEQLTALHAAGVDPRTGDQPTVWQPGWTDVRDGSYRALLRTAVGSRMTFAIR